MRIYQSGPGPDMTPESVHVRVRPLLFSYPLALGPLGVWWGLTLGLAAASAILWKKFSTAPLRQSAPNGLYVGF